MADRSHVANASKDARPRSRGSWLALLGFLTLLAGAVGAVFGTYLVSKVEKAVGEKSRLEEATAVRTVAYDPNVRLTRLGTIVTNLAGPGDAWVRLEASVVLHKDALPNAEVAIAEARQDLVAYLRTVSASQIEGPSGLQHLREDLADRVALRTEGKVREFFIETLVVQ